jgi:dihydroorotate dehydrogenase
MESPAVYQTAKTWKWNLQNCPAKPTRYHRAQSDDFGRGIVNWTCCGLPVASPLGVAAGPLLNGRWILHYAALGFDVLTYKTVRSQQMDCFPLPNLQPIHECVLPSDEPLIAVPTMNGSWAISFGMPSVAPEDWRADVCWTRQQLPHDKKLIVSVVGTQRPGMSLEALAKDYARCAKWAADAGADGVEVNLSCPNVSTVDGQLYQQPDSAGCVVSHVRGAIGTTPLIAKIGAVADAHLARRILEALDESVTAIAMTNCIGARVVGADSQPLFDGNQRGIGGHMIRETSIRQVAMFAGLRNRLRSHTTLIGIGGISTAAHVRQYLDAGAECVQLATAAMTNPLAAQEIMPQLVAAP